MQGSIKSLTYVEFDKCADFAALFDLALNEPGPPFQAALREANRQLIDTELKIEILEAEIRHVERIRALRS